MNQLPLWIQALQALATPAIAIGGGLIAYRQWRTAERKLILELFERRLTAYNKIMDAFRPIFRDGGLRNIGDFLSLATAIEDARFLFGDEVRNLLLKVREDAALISTADGVISDLNAPDRSMWIDTKYNRLLAISERFELLPSVIEPYMRLAEKRPQTLAEKLKERNRMRLSYADEKQK